MTTETVKTRLSAPIGRRKGYACVGLYQPLRESNVGGALRAAQGFGAAAVLIEGRRFERQATDASLAYRDLPVFHVDDLLEHIPFDCVPIAVELVEGALPLPSYAHPERGFYIFGPEDGSVPKKVMERCRETIQIPSKHCLNLAAAVNVVLYDRSVKRGL